MIVSGHGFAPGSEVSVLLKAASESEARAFDSVLVADASGFVAASLVVPFDLAPSDGLGGEQPWTAMRVELGGVGPSAATRRLSEIIAIDPPGGACTQTIAAAGDIAAADGSAAPSAAASGAPGTILSLGPSGPRVDIVPGDAANAVEPDSNQIFEVALLGSPAFDATDVRHAKMRFGNGRGQTPMGSTVADVNGDGFAAQVLRLMARQTQIACGDTVAWVRADDPKAVTGTFEIVDRVTAAGCGDG